MDIYLVRHGEAAASWGEDPDPGLSALGRQQAGVAADTLAQRLAGNAQIVSSPLRRARETADPLAARLGLDVREDAAFREVPAPVPLPQRQAWLRQFMRQQWSEQDAGLLAWRDTALQYLRALESPGVVFTHFLVINAVVGQVLGRREILCFWPDNGSITHLRRSGDALSLVEQGEEMKTLVN
jgi:probable phosphoglycerate mutase